jgi:hypothetical protein
MDLEDRPSFDRAAAVRAWRLALLGRGGLTVADVDELQDHLEGVEAELPGALRPEEAFWIAAHRVGTPEALTREYAKVRPNAGWLLRAQWAALGVLALWVVTPLANAIGYGLVALLASVPNLRPLAAVLHLFGPIVLLVAGLVAVAVAVRRWGGPPEAFEKVLSFPGLASRWSMVLASVAFTAWNVGFSSLAGRASAHASGLLNVIGEPAALQSQGWFMAALLVSYVAPVLLLMVVLRLQRQRSSSYGTVHG